MPNVNLCTAGNYCPAGASEPIPCPPGKYCRACTDDDALATGCAPKDCSEWTNSGVYCEGGLAEPEPCPAGSECPADSSLALPILCQPGTWQPDQGQTSCEPCTEGYFCPTTGITSTDQMGICHGGYECEEGQSNAGSNLCQESFYRPEDPDEKDCISCDTEYCPDRGMIEPLECPQGSLCLGGVIDGPCPRGAYCVRGEMTKCDPGTYRNLEGGFSQDMCFPCPAGYYCTGVDDSGAVETGTVNPEPCNEGFFCPTGSTSGTENSCQSGSFCPAGSPRPIECHNPNASGLDKELGYYCPNNEMAAPRECPAGSLCQGFSLDALALCPAGYYCDTDQDKGVVTKQKCPKGTFDGIGESDTKVDVTFCSNCPAGFFTNTEGAVQCEECTGGYYCPGGCTRSNPQTNGDCLVPMDSELENLITDGFICPTGWYCEPGNNAQKCPAGTYNNKERAYSVDFCVDCPAGVECPEGSSDYPTDDSTCPPGKYCEGTNQDDCGEGYYCDGSGRKPCPVTTYGNNPVAESENDCIPCETGHFCDEPGLSEAEMLSKICADGFYCDAGSDTRMQIPCPIGSYCTGGLREECTGATYTSSMNQASCLDCPARYTCLNGRISPCPAGSFCEANTETGNEQNCPIGTWSNQERLATSDECMICPAGFMCDTEGINSVQLLDQNHKCPAGYWCAGAVEVNVIDNDPPARDACDNGQNIGKCPIGFKCPEGSSRPIICPAGTYQNEEGAADCKTCEEREYCHPGASTIDNVMRGECPAGYFCPSGTRSKYENPCPQGTYNPNVGSAGPTEDDACLPCLEGSFCGQEGLSSPSGLCKAGYYCGLGKKIPTDRPCGVGNYCPEGSTAPQPCPVGKYCPSRTMTDAMLENDGFDCSPGYLCQEGSQSPNPVSGRCNPGNYCPAGTTEEIKCPEHTFNDQRQAEKVEHCKICPPGYDCSGEEGLTELTDSLKCLPGSYCEAGAGAVPCSRGHFCPDGSGWQQPCPPGEYQSREGESSCDTCPEGSYCDPYESGSGVIEPEDCPAGYYCRPGTTFKYEFPCPIGTFRAAVGAQDENECENCTPGHFCINQGQEAVSGDCSPGFICGASSQVPNPQNGQVVNPSDDDVNFICPTGHFCPFLGSDCSVDTDPDIDPWGLIGWAGSTNHASNRCIRQCPGNDEDTDGIGKFNDNTGQSLTRLSGIFIILSL